MAYKFLQINDIAKSGLNSDIMPWDLPGGFLTELSNVRIVNNKLMPFGGSSDFATLPPDLFPGFIMGTLGNPKFWIIAGRDSVYVYDGNVFSDISSALGYGGIFSEELWQGCYLSNIPILNNPQNYPEYWAPQNAAQILQPLPWDAGNTWRDVGETAKIIRSHKQYLFALNLESSTYGELKDGVRWSAPADIGDLPPTWDPLDTSQVAGLTTLGGGGGEIIDGLSLRDAFAIYRESGITIFDFVGGEFVWRVRNLSETIQMVAPDSIVEVKGKHFLIGDGDILLNDGNSIRSMLHNRIRNRFISDYDAEHFSRCYAIRNTNHNEVWFCIPEAGHVYPNLAYIYNWRDDTWSIRDIPESPFSAYGVKGTVPITWDNILGTWDSVLGKWAQNQASPLDDIVVACTQPTGGIGSSGELRLLDVSSSAILTPFDTNIERVGFALEGLGKVNTITRIYPHIEGPGLVNIQIGSQDYPGAPTRWKPAVEFDPTMDRKVDVRTTGELHCYRITSVDSSNPWRMSGMDFEYVDAGAR